MSDAKTSPWLTTQEACAYLRFDGPARLRSLYRFLTTHGIPRIYRSPKRLLIARADLDQALTHPTAARRRNRMKLVG